MKGIYTQNVLQRKKKGSIRKEGAKLSAIYSHSAKYFKMFFKQSDKQLYPVKASICTDTVLAQV